MKPTNAAIESIEVPSEIREILGSAAVDVVQDADAADWLTPERLMVWLDWAPLRVQARSKGRFDCVLDLRRWALCRSRLAPSTRVPIEVHRPLKGQDLKSAALVCFMSEILSTALLKSRRIPSAKAIERLGQHLPERLKPTSRAIAAAIGVSPQKYVNKPPPTEDAEAEGGQEPAPTEDPEVEGTLEPAS